MFTRKDHVTVFLTLSMFNLSPLDVVFPIEKKSFNKSRTQKNVCIDYVGKETFFGE